jgi:hypothetical protein
MISATTRPAPMSVVSKIEMHRRALPRDSTAAESGWQTAAVLNPAVR